MRVAPVDLTASTPFATTSMFERFIETRGRPHWSGDGKHLLFISCGPVGGGPCTSSIWSMDTGIVRDVPHGLGYMAFPRLSHDGGQIITGGRDRKGRQGIYLIDVKTGGTSLVMEPPRGPGGIRWAHDNRSIYRLSVDASTPVFFQRDLESGAEREIFRVPLPGARSCQLSPDIRFASCITTDSADKASLLVVMPVAGGAHQTILRAAPPQEVLFFYQWTPDSRALVAQKYVPGSTLTPELWLAPLEREPRKLDVDMSRWVEAGHLQLHPSGKYAAYVANAGEEGAEIWALENFLPAPATSSR